MKSKILSIIILILLLFVIQLGVLINWQTLTLVNILLAFLIFYASEGDDKNIWWYVLLVGLLSDFFSPLYFGIFTFSYLLVLAIIFFLGKSFLTNKSLYTLLILNLIGSFIFKFFIILVSYLNNFLLFSFWQIIFYHLFIAIIFESIFMILLYFIYFNFYKNTNA